jgi:hypothetical protein
VTTTSDVRTPTRVAPPTGPAPAPPGRTSAADTKAEPGPVHRHLARASDAAAGHAREARAAAATSWAFSESPPPAGEMWRQVLPVKGEAPNKAAWLVMAAAGLFRALVISLCWLVALSVAGNLADTGRRTRIRAGVGLALFVLVVCVGAVARALSP